MSKKRRAVFVGVALVLVAVASWQAEWIYVKDSTREHVDRWLILLIAWFVAGLASVFGGLACLVDGVSE